MSASRKPKTSSDDYDPFDVFDIIYIPKVLEAKPAQAPAAEALAEPRFNYNSTLEITMNHPRDRAWKLLSIPTKVQVYKTLWNELKNLKNTTNDFYVIEYCRDGEPHLHGYIQVAHNAIYPEGLVMDYVRHYYKQLPRSAWKQIFSHPYFEYFQMFKAPALCINHKSALSSKWSEYIEKDIPKTGGENCVQKKK